MKTQLYFQGEIDVTARLVTCIMDVRHIKSVSKESPLRDVVSATCVSDVFSGLIAGKFLTFWHYSILKWMICTLCGDCQELQMKLKVYEEVFSEYTKLRIVQSTMYQDKKFQVSSVTPSKDRIELSLITDDRFNECTPIGNILNLEEAVTTTLHCNQFDLHLVSFEPWELRLQFAISFHIAKSAFPLTYEEWNNLTEHGVVQMKCMYFHYTKQEEGIALCRVGVCAVCHSILCSVSTAGEIVSLYRPDLPYSSKGKTTSPMRGRG